MLYTCFIALQDVRLDMGPTTWYPGTNTGAAHEAFKGEATKDELLKTYPAVLGTLSKGPCAIYDSRCLHCGTANKSMNSRSSFYFSIQKFKNWVSWESGECQEGNWGGECFVEGPGAGFGRVE